MNLSDEQKAKLKEILEGANVAGPEEHLAVATAFIEEVAEAYGEERYDEGVADATPE